VVIGSNRTLGRKIAMIRTGAERLERGDALASQRLVSDLSVAVREPEPFLRIPPFPGARAGPFTNFDARADTADHELLDRIRALKVGGTFWAKQPRLPHRYVLVREGVRDSALKHLAKGVPIIRWSLPAAAGADVEGECDPWHMLAGATMLVAIVEDELFVIASMLGVPTSLVNQATGDLVQPTHDPPVLCGGSYANPFNGQVMSALEAVELCGFWRRLIDSNRDIAGGLGFAFWKRDYVGRLLWAGSEPFRFMRSAREAKPGVSVAIWRAKTLDAALARLERAAVPLVEVEDGFLRSKGLGADCVPPLSITVDRLGAYFDPSRPSELELLLQEGFIDDELLERSRRLRKLIVDAGLAKYEGSACASLERPVGDRRLILVPGQVEDDRAVQCGGCGLVSNLELLRRVREGSPDCHIIYKPHPDVLAGHRQGNVPEREALTYADQIVTDAPISALIGIVDEVHVNTSLAGFEALMRGKEVTTYGVPFYAAWGLTRDLGPVPGRRTAKRTLDELVAATLLIYPRYLDPVTGLPCPAEVVVERLSSSSTGRHPGLIVLIRRLQGKIRRGLRSLVQ
jgi:capsular polysaccharide export protein